MTSAARPIPLIPSLQVAVDRFLTRSRFAARTRDSYTLDLAPLLAHAGDQPVSALTYGVASAYLAAYEHLAASAFNRRYAAPRSFARWCKTQGWLHDDPLLGLERRPHTRRKPRALDPARVEARPRAIHDARDRTLFWLIYDGALRCREALVIDWDTADTRDGRDGRTCTDGTTYARLGSLSQPASTVRIHSRDTTRGRGYAAARPCPAARVIAITTIDRSPGRQRRLRGA